MNEPDTKEWLAAIKLKSESLEEMNTWALVEISEGWKSIKFKWVNGLKPNAK